MWITTFLLWQVKGQVLGSRLKAPAFVMRARMAANLPYTDRVVAICFQQTYTANSIMLKEKEKKNTTASIFVDKSTKAVDKN